MYWRLLPWRLGCYAAVRWAASAHLGLAAFLLAAVVASAAAQPAATRSVDAVVQRYYAAMDAKDVGRTVALYSPHPVVQLGALHSGVTVLTSQEQLRAFYDLYFSVQGPIHHHIADLHYDGDSVIVHSTVTWDHSSLTLDLTQRLVIQHGQISALFDNGTCTC